MAKNPWPGKGRERLRSGAAEGATLPRKYISGACRPKRRGLLGADDVVPDLASWHAEGLKTALVTLVAIDGGSPRPLGAQMAVAEDGRYSGYLSGGCLEKAVAVEAQAAIRDGCNKLVRYGQGSPYFDITLPCGSGLELYLDQKLNKRLVKQMAMLRAVRRPFTLETNLECGNSRILSSEAVSPHLSTRQGAQFQRAYMPALKILLVGGGPVVGAIAELAAVVGLDLQIVSPDDATRKEVCSKGFTATGLTEPHIPGAEALDPWTAAILAFHEHHWEPPLLAAILRSQCFYIGVLGSRAVHEARSSKLFDLGVSDDDIARLNGPIGMIAGAKCSATLAVGIIAEVLSAAKIRGLVY